MHCPTDSSLTLRRCFLWQLGWFIISLAANMANASDVAALIQQSCADCHSGSKPAAGIAFDEGHWQQTDNQFQRAAWEKALKRLRTGQMPPPDAVRPDPKLIAGSIEEIEAKLERLHETSPVFGTPNRIRRLTRFEYQNAVRDLLNVYFDAAAVLPKDETSLGFDNITVDELTPLLLSRYLDAATQIARKATAAPGLGPDGLTLRIPADRTQEAHVDGLPFGTRGGVLFQQQVGQGGSYRIQLRLARDRDERVEGLSQPHSLDILVDGVRMHRFTIEPPQNRDDHTQVDKHLHTILTLQPGLHTIGVTFVQSGSPLSEIKRQPFDAAYNRHRHPRTQPALYEVSLVGPMDAQSPDPKSSLPFFVQQSTQHTGLSADAIQNQARQQLRSLLRRAYRQPIDDELARTPLLYFDQGYARGGYLKGMEEAIASILVSPHFLFRIESDSPKEPQGRALELASRLSFFLWGSVPDEPLLDAAEDTSLLDRNTQRLHVDRMLKDEKTQVLMQHFVGQWLQLQNLDAWTPDLRKYPDFDDNLRRAFCKETELLFAEIIRNDLSVMTLLDARHTYVNERLAKHYRIPNVVGDPFRKVELGAGSDRGGILRHGSVLAVTSYATRTSPTIRGNWILKNLLGVAPPPPPPNVPPLEERRGSIPTSLREQLELHRQNPQCASCHQLMDPLGLAMEHFDALGRRRTLQDGMAIDSSTQLPDGTRAEDVRDVESWIISHKELFIATFVEKLLTYALARPIAEEEYPEIRKIVRDSASRDNRFSAIIEGIVTSRSFQIGNSP